MTIARTGVRIDVEGADSAAAALNSVARAESNVRDGARALDGPLDALGKRYEGMTGAVGRGLAKLNELGDVFKLVGFGVAGGALFGGLQDISDALSGLADKFGITEARVRSMAESGRALDMELVARSAKVTDLADAMERYARGLGLANKEQLTFAEQQAGLRGVVSGLVRGREQVQAEARKLTEQRAELQREAEQRGLAASGAGPYIARIDKRLAELQREELRLLGRRGGAPMMEAVEDWARETVERAKVVGGQFADEFRKAREAADERARSRRAGGGGVRATLPTFDELVAFKGRAEALTDRRAFARMERESEARLADEAAQAASLRAGIAEFGKSAAGESDTGGPSLIDAMTELADSFSGKFDQMARSATDAGGIMVQAIGTITSALGSMATNLIIAGDAGADGVLKAAGNALAGISAQAFGYAILLEAAAAAAALTGFFGWAAPGLAQAGGIMAGAGLTLGVMARGLGADKIGGGATGGGGSGGGGGRSSAAGTNPFAPAGGGATNVTVVIGGEVVTRGVQVETRRQEMRGGVAASRMARAS